MKTQRGFTLIEMMVVVAIVAILGSFLIGVSSRPAGANARNISDELVTTLKFAKLRASATRRTHRVIVQPQQVTVFPAQATGLTAPTFAVGAVPIQTMRIPKGVKVWNAQAGVLASPGASPAEDTALAYAIDIRPDGRATPSTLFVTDTKSNFRVLLYQVTGGSHARQNW